MIPLLTQPEKSVEEIHTCSEHEVRREALERGMCVTWPITRMRREISEGNLYIK